MAQVFQLSASRDQNIPDLADTLNEQMEFLINKIACLENAIRKGAKERKSIWFNIREGARQVYLDDISHCTADSNYTCIYFINGTKLLISLTLKSVQEMLDDVRFVRVHQSHLVNKEQVVTISALHECNVVLASGQTIPVSRSNRKNVKDCIMEKSTLSAI